MSTTSIHRPPHFIAEEGVYFVTASTINRDGLFKNDRRKEILKCSLIETAKRYGIELFAWVMLDNHYHIEFKLVHDSSLPRFIGAIHGRSSKLVNELDDMRGRKIWFQYWDSKIRGEIDFWMRFNYIHQNPVKHGCCKDLWGYPFSSCSNYKKEVIEDSFRVYPIIDFVVDYDV